MARLVHDRDGRAWSVVARAHLVDPAASRVHLDGGDAVLRAVLLGTSVLLVLAVLLSTPANLWLPGWVAGPVLLVAGTSLVLWVLRRPWSVTATNAGSIETGGPSAELRWVRGPWAAHRAVGELARDRAAWTTSDGRDLAGDLPFRS